MKAYFPEYGNTVECAASSSIIEQKQKVVGETVNQLLQHNRWAKDKTLEEMIMLVILTLENKKVIEDKSYNVILSIIRATITELQKKAPVLVNRALNKKSEEILKLKIEYNKPIVDLLLQKYIREIDSDR